MVLSEFYIEGLYGKYNLSMRVVENKLVLVAKNGASKTTLLRIIFYFLTKQWDNLCSFDFIRISATINSRSYHFNRNDYRIAKSPQDRIVELSQSYSIYKDFILTELSKWDLNQIRENSHNIELTAERYDMPPGLLAKFIDTLITERNSNQLFDWEQYILYLPTYRRIEEDFVTIFSDFSVLLGNYIKEFNDIDSLNSNDNLVNDSGEVRDSEMSYETSANTKSNIVPDDQLFRVLWDSRDREKWLRKKDSMYLELVEFGMDDISFKITEILKLGGNSSEHEGKLEKYLNVCNKYLNPEKSIAYDNNKLHVILNENPTSTIDLGKLSSGEKQIVALFFHLYLEDTKPFLIIDEPEISLSLRWQEEILKDILEADVVGLIVATHSPFIIGQRFKSFARGVNEFLV
ncbi:AAA family ATPase [Chitinophaga arvensicola]|uniref:AAA domain-containing protein, putative AbiEii toxin, Type IV TA system n=1 Tax=Chitinophaga arvensicola TaxID=29529 RepID=A0A1I0S794_9BACT|nr:AAA family ATPase [Chitinophaga arvensicola]SEW51620.1 AAA domain-containing protein, putative AbiEii toxin, Type IV TA system [Chitinophaga arvensicola]